MHERPKHTKPNFLILGLQKLFSSKFWKMFVENHVSGFMTTFLVDFQDCFIVVRHYKRGSARDVLADIFSSKLSNPWPTQYYGGKSCRYLVVSFDVGIRLHFVV